MPSSSLIVPSCPAGVAFHKEDFLHEGFNVDGFLARYAGNYGLDSLRDDLGMYLQVLRVAMIELINDDYADFVNLSSNLVGIDDKIIAIEEPVKEFKEQIFSFQTKLNLTKDKLEAKLTQRKTLHDQRVALRNLEHIINLLNKVERLLGLHEEEQGGNSERGPDQQLELTGDLTERVASDVNYLNHCVSKCEASAFVEEIRPRINIIGDRLHNAMESQFLTAIQDNDADVLKRCLRIYASVERISDAERLMRSKIIAPYLEDVILSKNLHSDPMGLSGICQNILAIIPDKLDLLLKLTNRKKTLNKRGSSCNMSDFNFVVNSLWPDIVEKFELQLPMVFSAGNPDGFHSNYITIMDFIKKLEAHMADYLVGEFRASKLLQNFIHRWNLPVYFQIRFQEIGGPVEEACQDLFALEIEAFEAKHTGGGAATENSNFHLKASNVIMNAVGVCWTPKNVFLRPLTQKFWKLTLQIIARYSKAVGLAASDEHHQSLLKSETASTASMTASMLGTSNLASNSASRSLAGTATAAQPLLPEAGRQPRLSPSPSAPVLNTKSHFRTSSDTTKIDTSNQYENTGEALMTAEDLNQRLIWVYLDANKISEEKLSGILCDLVWPVLDSDLAQESAKDYFIESLEESRVELRTNLTRLSDVITNRVSEKSSAYLKQVSDIPRLYRRTNRELPAKPCTYMTSLLEPINHFSQVTAKQSPQATLHQWLVAIFAKVSVKLLSNVSEVLDNVQKMEESLLRLRRVRDKANSATKSSTTNEEKVKSETEKSDKNVSDDDKIRLQLFVDVKHYLKTMESLGVKPTEVTHVEKLEELVKQATKSCI